MRRRDRSGYRPVPHERDAYVHIPSGRSLGRAVSQPFAEPELVAESLPSVSDSQPIGLLPAQPVANPFGHAVLAEREPDADGHRLRAARSLHVRIAESLVGPGSELVALHGFPAHRFPEP